MTTILASIKNIITASNNITASQLGDDGMKIVNDAVVAAQDLGGSGPSKFSAALAQAGTDLLAAGKDVSLYVLHLAIEAAVTQLNAAGISTAVATQTAAQAASAAPASSETAAVTAPPAATTSIAPLSGAAFEAAVAFVKEGGDINTATQNYITDTNSTVAISSVISQIAAALVPAPNAAA